MGTGVGGDYAERGTGAVHFSLGLRPFPTWPWFVGLALERHSRGVSGGDDCEIDSTGACKQEFPMGGHAALVFGVQNGRWTAHGGVARIRGTYDKPVKANGVLVGIGLGSQTSRGISPQLKMQYLTAAKINGEYLSAFHVNVLLRIG
jgi:hypothetical protein